jgi:hypothetical protein
MVVIYILVIATVAVPGLFFFLKGARNIKMALDSTKWPKTSGMVIASEIKRSSTAGTRRSPASATFNADIVIRYTVEGKEYTTNTKHFGQTLGSGDKSEAVLQGFRYPEGMSVTVSYNPGNPAIGVMNPGLHTEAFWLAGAGLAFLLPAVLCMFLVPTMAGGLSASKVDDDAFAKSVQSAIDAAKRGDPPPPVKPPAGGGDIGMAIAAAVFGVVICGLGVLALTVGMQRMWNGAASLGWPTTEGEVIFNAGEHMDTDDTTDRNSYAEFVYRYEVAGTKHFSNLRRWAKVEGASSEEEQRIRTAYAKGAKVKVFYFPIDPDVAVLEPGNANDSLLLPGIGAFCLLFSLLVFFVMVPGIAKS